MTTRKRLASLLWVVAILLSAPLLAYEIEEQRSYGPAAATNTLKVISTADIDLFAPLLQNFVSSVNSRALAANEREPSSINLVYTVVSSAQLMRAIYTEKNAFDIAISSAMDLQTKLANDGFTQAHVSAVTDRVPSFGKWRNDVFAFTQESASIVYSPAALQGLSIPTSRQELLELLRNNRESFLAKVGTYDIRESGLGYLFATQDARTSDVYWRLTEVMGGLKAKLYCCSGKMISAIERGELAIAYNVLGSYAQAKKKQGAEIEILNPQEFTTLMLRSAVIPVNALQPELAGQFIDHLLRISWLDINAKHYPFPVIKRNLEQQDTAYMPIRLGPGLLVYLDEFKRKRFIEDWKNAIIQ